MTRDAAAISHHYDVSNRFYELVLGPSMTYTCAVFQTPETSLEDAQTEKYDLVCRKLDLQPGQRLLDVGCGWGSMVRHAAREYGVRALGVTLSLEQAQWAKEAIDREGLSDLAEVRHLDYRDVMESGFDAVSSIGLTEHIGVRNYPSYFTFLRDRLRPEGRLLNHCITRPAQPAPRRPAPFIDRYVFPDGELTGSGRIITAVQNTGLEVHARGEPPSPLRAHPRAGGATTSWSTGTSACAEVGEGTARVWGLYMAGSRVGFERNTVAAAPGARRQDHRERHRRFPASPHLVIRRDATSCGISAGRDATRCGISGDSVGAVSTRAEQYVATVESRQQLSAHLVRLTLGGAGLAGFASTGVPDEWVGLVVPGQFQSRYYTVRSLGRPATWCSTWSSTTTGWSPSGPPGTASATR